MDERARVSLDLGDLHQPSGILPVFSRGASLIHADPWQRPGHRDDKAGLVQTLLLLYFLFAALEAELYVVRSEEHTSELQSLMRISYAVFCLKKKQKTNKVTKHTI